MNEPIHSKPDLESLRADLGDEAKQLRSTVQRLEAWSAPRPSAADTARLIEQLQPTLQQKPFAPRSPLWLATFLRIQFRLMREEIWLASALVMVIGLLVTLVLSNTQSTPETLPFVFIAPIITAVGVAFLYGPEVNPALEIELAAPTTQRIILLARLTLIFAFNVVLSIIASVLLVAFNPNLSLWALIITWLAPMAFLSALAFLLSIWFFNSLAGMMVSLFLWVVQVLKSNPQLDIVPMIAQFPSLLAEPMRPWLFVMAIGMGLAALWIAGHSEKWAEPAL